MTNFQKLVSHMSHALSVPLLATYCNKKEKIFNSTTKYQADRISRKKLILLKLKMIFDGI